MSDAPLTDPGPSTPDSADWTWVLSRHCPDCGFDARDVRVDGIPEILHDASSRYAAVLGRADVRTRPSSGVWSPLEYVCHVRDVCDVMRGRVEQILAGGGELVHFANWDQDETALEKAYWRSDPSEVRREVTRAFDAAAAAYALPVGEQWTWPAERSNGSRFTTDSLAKYFLHDVIHHLWDVNA
ncbi:methyltransferase type 12 [Intrasporangium oryzae NRRL B-24470]|uniref:Methyltransferase type 12 n=1 Tax=Intrasporangium oryzae NRRL B-24470 TaxID=1386089 RepID=W9GB28_9MICO|nr:DinB family protein [Intrasporangium oryzae]EWT02437.1 methyltransferase type 12 [Intrasporangium oryzae NRRL B-24470]